MGGTSFSFCEEGDAVKEEEKEIGLDAVLALFPDEVESQQQEKEEAFMDEEEEGRVSALRREVRTRVRGSPQHRPSQNCWAARASTKSEE